MSTKIGTLTIDMILKTGNFQKGMNDSKKTSRSTLTQMEKDAIKYGKVMGASMAAAVTAVGAMTAAYVSSANEVARFAQISGSSATEFQRQAAGARAMGIEGDKLSDVYKDVNEKLGEFARTGGGGAADFFEQIAPSIGVTIDQFKRLSGPEALQFYKDSLDKAGVSQKEQIFYLESLASDTSLLIPLLADGGRGFDAFGESVARSGAIMSDEGIAKAQEMAAMQIELKNQLAGVKNQIVEAAIPAILSLATAFGDGDEAGGQLAQVLGGVTHAAIVTVGSAAIGAATAVSVLGQSIAQAALLAQKADAWLGQAPISGIGNDITGKIGRLFGGPSVKFGDSAKAARREYELMSAAASEAGLSIQSTISEAAKDLERLSKGQSNQSSTVKSIQDQLAASRGGYESGGYGLNQKQIDEQLRANSAAAKAAAREAQAAERAIESERAARKSAFDQFVAEQRTEQQIAHETFIERTALINEFTVHGSVQYSQLAFAASHAMSPTTASI